VAIIHIPAGDPEPEVCPKCGHVVDWDLPEHSGGVAYDMHKEACTFCGRHPLKTQHEPWWGAHPLDPDDSV